MTNRFLQLNTNDKVAVVYMYYETRATPYVTKDTYHTKTLAKQRTCNNS